LKPGNHNREICIQEDFRDALEQEMNDQGYLTYYDDVRLYRESDAGLTAAFTDTEQWIAAWNADLDSMYKFIAKRECMEEILPHLKMSGSMLVASSLAIAASVAATL